MLLSWSNTAHAQYTISGKVVEAKSKNPVDYVSVYLVGLYEGTYTDSTGNFTIQTPQLPDSLSFSQPGYVTQTIRLDPAHINNLHIALNEDIQQLTEVVITADADPGKTFMKKVVARKPYNNPDQYDQYSYQQYTRGELDLNNVDDPSGRKHLKAMMLNIFNTLDTGRHQTDQLPIYFTETLTQIYHTSSPSGDEATVIAKKSLDLETDKLLRHLEKFNINFNIYDNWLPVFNKTFASPLADKGWNYYHYYINDSVLVDNKWQYQIQFVPIHQRSDTFTGMMWINDSTFSVDRIDMQMNPGANLNFVRDVQFQGAFALHDTKKRPDQVYMPKKFISEVTFESGLDLLGIPTNVDTTALSLTYTTTSIVDQVSIDENNLAAVAPVMDAYAQANASNQSEDFWLKYRTDSLTLHEKAIYQMIDSVRANPRFKIITNLAAIAVTGYWDIHNRWRLGHYGSLFSANPIEGLRFRLGAYSLPGISKKWNVHGYLAYGTRDRKFKADLGIGYLYNDNIWSRTSVYARSDYDVLFNVDDELDQDNIISSLLRKPVPSNLTYVKEVVLAHDQQIGRNLLSSVSLAYHEYNPSFDFQYPVNQDVLPDDALNLAHQLPVLEWNVHLRYAKEEEIRIFNYDLVHIKTEHPVINLDFVQGFKTSITPFAYRKIRVGVSQKLKLPPKSVFYYNLQLGKTFGTLPYLLLDIPRGNQYFVASRYAFNTMLPYEFVADRYASLNSRLSLGGLLLDRIPLLEKLGWKERLSFNTYWGSLSNDNVQFNKMNNFKTIEKAPFMEAGVGIENIFHLLSIEYLWRLNYLDDPQTIRGGVFAGVTFVF